MTDALPDTPDAGLPLPRGMACRRPLGPWAKVLLAACLLALLACGQGDESDWQVDPDFDPQSDPLFDPQLVTLDPVVYTFFDGLSGSILPGDGWGPVEEATHQTEELVTFAWATAEEVTVRARKPSQLPVDFLARCLPFVFADAPPQTLTLAAGERTLGTRDLEKGWQEVRIPIPDEVFGDTAADDQLTELRLGFAYARQVSEVVPKSPDSRRLAASCQYLALVPREVRDAEAFLQAANLDPETQRLSLAVGTSATFPLPAGSDVALRLGEVHPACRKCIVQVDLVAGDDERQLWQGEPTAASGLELSLTTAESASSWLRLALNATGGRAFDPGRTIDVRLPPAFLTPRRREARQETPPNVFIYMIDTLRADSLTPYGAQHPTSPRIAEFAEDAVTYQNVWSASSWTLPAVVSVLTGTYPLQHQIMQGRRKLSTDNVPSLSTLLGAVGYETFGISQSFVASSQFGIHTGFDRFVLSDKLNRWELRSQELRRHLLQNLRQREKPASPIFAYLHSVDPHGPYGPQGEDRRFAEATPGQMPAEQYLGKVFMQEKLAGNASEVAHLRALYDGEVAFTDRQFGGFIRMLQYLDLYDNSLIILLSDHGEEFGEHGGFEHGRTVFEEMLRVPLIIKYPRAEWAGTEIAQRVSTVDLVPTILRSIGTDSDHLTLDGHSIRPPDLENRPPSQRAVFAQVNPAKAEDLASVDYRAFVLDNLKCVESLNRTDQFGREIAALQVFDLAQDPLEQRPLPPDAPEVERCRGLLERWLASRQKPAEIPWSEAGEKAQEELRALGYIE